MESNYTPAVKKKTEAGYASVWDNNTILSLVYLGLLLCLLHLLRGLIDCMAY
ncbi:MAG: hypothetical protein Greene071436_354 [Parcubacteria group bacterium Greene0714_36]|nr:MAG: hypothetical protein Greene071436_354 [Parcubacteria group bacterium Greene0714_36]